MDAARWSLTVPAGTGAAAFYYLDTRAGSHVLTATGAGATSGTQTVTVAPPRRSPVRVTPVAGDVRAARVARFTATATDPYGNAVAASFTWKVTPASLGASFPGREAPRRSPPVACSEGHLVASGVTAAGIDLGAAPTSP